MLNREGITDPDEILAIAMHMKSLVENKTELAALEIRFKTFKKNFPQLYNMILEAPEGYWEILEKILGNLKLLKEGKKTMEETEKDVVHFMAGKYNVPLNEN